MKVHREASIRFFQQVTQIKDVYQGTLPNKTLEHKLTKNQPKTSKTPYAFDLLMKSRIARSSFESLD